ncbi:flagellar export chaperone FliS [Alteribacter aurantiacus]|uniref:flagellar export chaperone FliS n=1 Tax=Alteribacter aurantiacus TaxID=254410 RepID=UPI0003F5EDD0|nr:flagellar export chaperone FliS [Alteribacter aurantiacus]
MAVRNPYANYKQQNMQTKTPAELTLMLYEGCVKFIRRGEKALVEGNMEVKNENLIKAQNIIRELMVTLKVETDTARNMMQMYDFILSRLTDANTKNDVKALKEAERFVVDFYDTWKEVIKIDRQRRHGQGVRG